MTCPFSSESVVLSDFLFCLGETNPEAKFKGARISGLKLISQKSKPIKSDIKPGRKSNNPAINLKNPDVICGAGFTLWVRLSFTPLIIFQETSLRIKRARAVVNITRITVFSEPIEDATSKMIKTSMISNGTKSPRILLTCVPKFSNG